MFFLFILVTFAILIIAIHTSKIGIDVENLIINTEANEKINKEGKIYVYLLLFNKIKLFRKNVRNIPMKDVKFEASDFDIKILKNKDIKINYLELIQNIFTTLKWDNVNKNLLKINLNGIFTIYLMHYIYKFIKDNIKERFMDKPLNKNLNFKIR